MSLFETAYTSKKERDCVEHEELATDILFTAELKCKKRSQQKPNKQLGFK
jgi:hypothetical protein